MSLNTSYIQIKVTQPGLCRMRPRQAVEKGNRAPGLVPKKVDALFNLISQKANCADPSSEALIRVYSFKLICCYYMSFKALSWNVNTPASSSFCPLSPLSRQQWLQLLLQQGWRQASTSTHTSSYFLLSLGNFSWTWWLKHTESTWNSSCCCKVD